MAVHIKVLQFILEGSQPEIHQPIPTLVIPEANTEKHDIFTVFDHARPLGISPGFSEAGRLVAIAIADDKQCRIIEFDGLKYGNKKPPPVSAKMQASRRLLQENIFCRPEGDTFAFNMGPLSLSLAGDLGIRISNGVDIQSTFSSTDRKPLSAMEAALGDSDSIKIKEENFRTLFLYQVYHEGDRNCFRELCMRAWISQFLATFGDGIMLFEKAKRINTVNLSDQRLAMISKANADSVRLDQKKPLQSTHQVQAGAATKDHLQLVSKNFNNKIRAGISDRKHQITVEGSNGTIVVDAMVGAVSGRTSTVNSTNNIIFTNKTVATVTSIGRDDPTMAEARRAATILLSLQGDPQMDNNPWIKNIWFIESPDTPLIWPEEYSSSPPTTKPSVRSSLGRQINSIPPRVLNTSQQKAVNTMLSELDRDRITIIQGPPGTGKTSVISSFVQFAVQHAHRTGIWLVAQSNVAVKNIAEKLFADGFRHWKLLVSKDFRYDWHEHLYDSKIEEHIIQSDQFRFTNRSDLKDIRVVICTLSMLSNNNITKFTKEIPLRTLVVDEASQIEIGDYISVFSSFKSTLRKVCFIGDDKQLPPYGQEDLADLQSIFEVAHLRNQVLFLDTQYRMPPQIGQIISDVIYNGLLKSNPNHPITNQIQACYFIDVDSKEKQLTSKSFMNELECGAILKIAKKLQEQSKSYRIITPYEGQRSYIEEAMKAEGLDWGDKCFNVDSFQGNEDDYIIISLVRTRDIGFLKSLRRTNVMLTRCKKGMFIVSNEVLLTGVGAETLVGIFLSKTKNAWLSPDDFEAENF